MVHQSGMIWNLVNCRSLASVLRGKKWREGEEKTLKKNVLTHQSLTDYMQKGEGNIWLDWRKVGEFSMQNTQIRQV